jgi:hypothetical protein
VLTRRKQRGLVPTALRSNGRGPPAHVVFDKPRTARLITAEKDSTRASNVVPRAGWLWYARNTGGSIAGHSLGPKRMKLARFWPNSHIAVDLRFAWLRYSAL